MEHQQHGEGGKHTAERKSDLVTLRLKRKTVIILTVIVVLLVLGYVYKGLFVAATVNGMPITRLAVIQELEKISGKQALDSLITQKLIDAEARKNNIVVSGDEIDAEISKIRVQVETQGGTLEQALTTQGMTMDILKEQIRVQKILEKLVPDKVEVTDAEVAQYMKDNGIRAPEGEEEKYHALVKDQLTQQKLGAAKQKFVTDLKANAKIRTFAGY